MPRALRIPEEQWECHRERIRELRSKMQLKYLMLYMQENHGFIAKEHEYKKKFSEWGLTRKNTKDPNLLWTAVNDRLEKRKRDNKESQVIIGGEKCPPRKVRHEISRHFLSTTQRMKQPENLDLPQHVVVDTPSPVTNVNLSPVGFPRDITYQTLPWMRSEIVTLPQTLSSYFPHSQPPATSANLLSNFIPENLYSPLMNNVPIFNKNNSGMSYHKWTNPPVPETPTALQASASSAEDFQMWLKRLSSSGNMYNFVLPLFRHVIYLASNNLLNHAKLSAILHWTIEKRLFWVIERLGTEDSPTTTAFISQLLCGAIVIGDVHVVRSLLSLGASASSNLSCTCCFHEYPLRRALSLILVDSSRGPLINTDSIENRLSIFEILLSAGADVNAGRDQTLLQIAVKHGSKRFTRYLLEAGAEVDAPATERYAKIAEAGLTFPWDIRTPIHIAYGCHHGEIMQILLEYGANIHACVPWTEGWRRRVKEEFLATAVRRGDFTITKQLLAGGAHPLLPLDTNSTEFTPLQEAVNVNDVAMTALLLGHLSEIIRSTVSSSPSPELSLYYKIPLYFFAKQNSLELTSLLVEYLTNLTNAAGSGITPGELSYEMPLGLTKVTRQNSVEIIKLKDYLLEQAMLRDSLDIISFLMHDLVWTFSLDEMIKICGSPNLLNKPGVEFALRFWALKAGININEANSAGKTLLSAACYAGNANIVKVLLTLGADISPPQEKHSRVLSPLLAAAGAETNPKGVLELFISAKAPLNSEALHLAARAGNTMLVDSILSAGVDPNSVHEVGRYTETVQSSCCKFLSTSLHVASFYGHVDVVESLLKAGADPNVTLSCGCTPLGFILMGLADAGEWDEADMLCSNSTDACAHIQLLNIMLQRGANPNQPFHACHYEFRVSTTESFSGKVLFPQKFDEMTEGQYNLITPLAYVAAYGNPKATEATRLLLASGAVSHIQVSGAGPTPLQSSAAYGSIETMKLILHNLKAVDGRPWCLVAEAYRGDANFPSAVEGVLMMRSFDKLEVLEAECGPLTSIQESIWLASALGSAVEETNVQLVKQLVRFGADPSVGYLRDECPRCYLSIKEEFPTPLQMLSNFIYSSSEIEDDEVALAEALLDAGADLNRAVAGPHTPLALAIESGREKLVRLYFARGVDVNPPLQAEDDWLTPLQAAAKYSDVELVRRMLKEGADVNADPAPAAGGTALQFAAIQGDLEMAILLLQHGADITALGSERNGRTALEGAAERGRLDMVHLLLENSGLDDREFIKYQCIRAGDFAEIEGHTVIAKVLREWEAEN